MANEKQNDAWPLAKFYFLVKLDDMEVPFQEVSGLETEVQTIEYRHGDNKQFSPIKMPGIKKIGNVTLRKGTFINDNTFWGWHSKIEMNVIQRKTVVIRLLDESGATTMSWKLSNAWPTKISGTDLKSDGNEVAIETIELAYEDLLIETN